MRILASALALIVLFGLSGCLNQSFVEAADTFHQQVGGEYLEYVNADDTKTEAEKDIRRNYVEVFGLMVQEAKQ